MSEIKERERDDNGRFIKGQSGNPTGRPATPDEVKTILKSATVPAAQLLTDTMKDDTVRIELRIKCAEILLDRVLGKAVQPLTADVSTMSYDLGELTTDELRRLAAYGESEETDDSASGKE